MPDDAIELSLSALDVDRLRDALDAYEYWQLGDVLPRNNGHVFIPGDLAPGSDRYWDGVSVTPDQREAIDEVIACRALSERLRDAADAARMSAGAVSEDEMVLGRYHEAVAELLPALRRMALAAVSAVIPGAAELVTFGEVDEDGRAILRIRRVLSADGTLLASSGQPGVPQVVENKLDDVGWKYLDLLLDLTGDEYFGETTVAIE